MTTISHRATAARRLARRGGAGDDGFTVIELLVVLLVLAVLVAVGIPTYFTIRNERTDGTAQANIAKVLVAAHAYWAEQQQSYNGLCGSPDCDGNAGGLRAQHPGVAVNHNTDSTNPNIVSVDVVNNGQDLIAAAFANGTDNCWAAISATTAGDEMDTMSSQFLGVFYAVDPASTLGHGRCYAGLFDTARLVGSPPQVGSWPST